MKINAKFFHFPPYLSTTWTQVRALYMKQEDLVVSLIDGTLIVLHGLKPEVVDAVFAGHAAFLESVARPTNDRVLPLPPSLQETPRQAGEQGGFPFMRISIDNLESLTSAMTHNPAQANLPDLPKEMLTKIAEIAKIVAPDEISNLPKPEPHCNCVHCQIAKAIHGEGAAVQEIEAEAVSEADLAFQQWGIEKIGDNLYTVANRLDSHEKYTVFLGEPVGCTCGKSGCEHILAVLKS